MLLARLQQSRPGCPFCREIGEVEGNDEWRRADRCVPREGWERGGMHSGLRAGARSASPGCSANNPSLHTHAEPQGKGLREDGAALRCGEGADESLDFVHSIAETPALLLPHTSGEQATREREGGRDEERHRQRCRGWLTSQCLRWGCPGAQEVNPGLCSPWRVLGKVSVQSHEGVACE